MAKKRTLCLSWAAVVIWMALIFNLSNQVAVQSNELSNGVTQMIVNAIEKIMPDSSFDAEVLNNLVRKNAHFVAYLILGVLSLNALRRSGAGVLQGALYALGICVLYAGSDEVHQLFVPGRGAQVKDVLIDSAGAVCGIGIYLLFSRISRRRADVEGTPQ